MGQGGLKEVNVLPEDKGHYSLTPETPIKRFRKNYFVKILSCY